MSRLKTASENDVQISNLKFEINAEWAFENSNSEFDFEIWNLEFGF